jgi:uncharacterized membrane protein YgdD (TMEM256/DUF423 family)
MDEPRLIDSVFRNHIHHTLRLSHVERLSYYNQILNYSIFGTLAVFVFVFCYSFYRKRDSPTEERKKQRDLKDFVMQRIGAYQAHARQKAVSAELLTDLPTGATPAFREMFEL